MGDVDESHLGSDDCEHEWWWQTKKKRYVCVDCTRRTRQKPEGYEEWRVQGGENDTWSKRQTVVA